MKNILKQCVLAILYIGYKLLPQRDQVEPVVLMYHSIGDNGGEFTITPEIFERQIRYLRNHNFTFITASKLSAWLTGREPMPHRAVLVTFDDGYKDFMTNALPVLKKYTATATLFVHTNRSGEPLGNNVPLMDWSEIRAAREAGIEIGDHSFSHPNLKTLSPQELSSEILNSREIFKKELGIEPKIFAYPGGKFNQTVCEALEKAGYETAFSINRGLVHRSTNPFQIPRFGLSRNTSWLEFKARLTPVNDWYETVTHF